MLARTPAKSIRRAQEPARRLSRDRQKAVRDKIVTIMRTVEPTPFAAEGPCRAGVRSSLCLQGWAWADADAVAAEIVAAALNIVGARRPTWQQGQPEWTQPGVHKIRYDRCRSCKGPLPETHFSFCCRECGDAWRAKNAYRGELEDLAAYARARRAAWSAKQAARVCEGCGVSYQPKRPNQRFCSQVCGATTFAGCKR